MMEIKNNNNNIDVVYLFLCNWYNPLNFSVKRRPVFCLAFCWFLKCRASVRRLKIPHFVILTRQISWSPSYHNSQVDFQKSSLTNLES